MKNRTRLLITLALAFVLVASVVSAGVIEEAGDLSREEVYHLLINFLLLAIVFYILQAAFFQTKEKPASTVALIVALFGAALLAWNTGRNDYLWNIQLIKDVFHLKVFVNFIVVAAFLFLIKTFFLDRLVPADQKKASEIGLVIVIILIAGWVAYMPFQGGTRHWDTGLAKGENYPYVWQYNWLVEPRLILLGDSKCYYLDEKSWGIAKEEADKTWFIANTGRLYVITKDGNVSWVPKVDAKKKTWRSVPSDVAESVKGQLKIYKEVYQSESGEIPDKKTLEAIEAWVSESTRFMTSGKGCYTSKSFEELAGDNRKPEKDRKPFLAKSKDGLKFGVLRGRSLVILVLGYVLIMWFFGFLNLAGEMKWVQRILAGYTAFLLANNGISIASFATIAYVLTMWILGKKTWDNVNPQFDFAGNKFKAGFEVVKTVFMVGIVFFLVTGLFNAIVPNTLFVKGITIPGMDILPGDHATYPSPSMGNVPGEKGDGKIIGYAVIDTPIKWGWAIFSTIFDIILIKPLTFLWKTFPAYIAIPLILLYLKFVGWDFWKKKKGLIFSFTEERMSRKAWEGFKRQLHRLNSYRFLNPVLGRVLADWGKEEGYEGQISPILYELRYELVTLWNWVLRLEVFMSKTNHVKHRSSQISYLKGELHGDKSLALTQRDIDFYKWGTPYIIDPDEFVIELKGNDRYPLDRRMTVKDLFKARDDFGKLKTIPQWSDTRARTGALDPTRIILVALKKLPELLSANLTQKTDEAAEHHRKEIKSDLAGKQGSLTPYLEEKQDSWKVLVKKIRNYSKLLYVRMAIEELATSYLMFGQSMMRGYRFARPQADCDVYEVRGIPHTPFYKFEVVRKLDTTKIGTDSSYKLETTNEKNEKIFVDGLYEVDNRGWVIKDLNGLRYLGYPEYPRGTPKPDYIPEPYRHNGSLAVRKLRNRNDIVYMNEAHLSRWLLQEWEGYLENMRTGYFNPRSRSWRDYQFRHLKPYQDFYYKNPVRRQMNITKEGRAAFDREALKNPGFHPFWGRQKIDLEATDKIHDTLPVSPLPSISVEGLSSYIISVVKNRTHPDYLEERLKSLDLFCFASSSKSEPFYADVSKTHSDSSSTT